MNVSVSARKKKDQSIEALRGVAIVLLVAYHAKGIADTPEHGDWYSYFAYTFDFVRMPLFTVISGFVYAMRPVETGKALAFAWGKARRVLAPCAAVLALWMLLNFLGAGDQIPLSSHSPLGIVKFYLKHPKTYWFLEAVFQVFLITALLERTKLLATVAKWAGCLLGACVLAAIVYADGEKAWLVQKLRWFSWDGVVYLLPYFILGIGLNRFTQTLRSAKVILPALAVFSVGMTLHQMAWYGLTHINTEKYGSPLALVVGVTGITLLFRIRRDLPLLPRLGYYSFPIYLFHRFGFEAMDHLCPTVGLTNPHALFLLYLLVGLSLPIVVEHLLLRSDLLATVFLGVRGGEARKVAKTSPVTAAAPATPIDTPSVNTVATPATKG